MQAAKAVGRLMPNVGGPSISMRRLLGTVVTSKLLYAAPVWASRATKYQTNKDMLRRAQKLAGLRITRCYTIVSIVAVLFLAEIPPADLLAKEREEIRRRRSTEPGAAVSVLARGQIGHVSGTTVSMGRRAGGCRMDQVGPPVYS